MCLLFHSWTPWEITSDRNVHYTTLLGASGCIREVTQQRTCKDCGKVQYHVTDFD